MTEVITPFRRRNPFLPVNSFGQRYVFTGTGRQRLNNSTDSGMPRRYGNRRPLGRAIRGRLARGRTRTLQKRKYSKTSNGILGGTNADNRLIYRKKRMPARRRKQWKRFVQKVNFVGERDLGTRTVLFNEKITTANSNDGKQGCLTFALYSFNNETKGWMNDLYQICSGENLGNPTAAAGGTVTPNTKVMFHSAVMDVTIRNTSTYNNGTTDVQTAEAALELDVYEMTMRNESSDNGAIYYSISQCLNAYDDPEIGGTGTGIEIQDRGASPFEFGSQMARFGIKIWKKTKYFIPNGQTITFQARDPKRHVARYGDINSQEGWNRKGWTKHYFVVYKLVPGLTRGTTVGTYKDAITVGLTRKYSYKIEGFNEPREKLYTGSYVPGNPT